MRADGVAGIFPIICAAILGFGDAAEAGSYGHGGRNPAQACLLYDSWGNPAGHDTDCLRNLGVEPRQGGTYRPLRREGEILYADPHVYYCPVSANNGLGHQTTVFTGSSFISDVFDMPSGGRRCTPQPPSRVLPGLK